MRRTRGQAALDALNAGVAVAQRGRMTRPAWGVSARPYGRRAALSRVLAVAVLSLACAAAGAVAVEMAPLDPVSPAGGLSVTPTQVVFPSTTSKCVFQVTRDGSPVPASEIKAQIAEGYGWMFEIVKPSKEPGQIVLCTRPGNTEKGTYDLVIRAGSEERRVRVVVSLEHEMGLLPSGAATGQTYVFQSLALPPYCYEGQILDLDFSELGATTWYSWRVNDTEVLEGVGESRLRYVLDRPGEAYVRMEARRDRSSAVIPWSGSTTVRANPVYEKEVARGTILTLTGPVGFRDYEWWLDGAPVATGMNYTRHLNEAGVYRIECIARSPENSPNISYSRNEWRVTVR